MEKIKVAVVIMQFMMLNTNCSSQNFTDSKSVEKIVIEYVHYEKPKKQRTVTDTSFINKFMAELDEMSIINKTSKVNNGRYDVNIYYKDGRKKYLRVIETVYDGIEIASGMSRYKNDYIHYLLHAEFAKAENP